MADSASSILLLRLQGTGDNVNLWGGYLNTALQTLERGQRGYQAYTPTGDATISWSNYSASNDFAVGHVKLVSGSVSAAFTLTLPNYQQKTRVWNDTGYSATLKTSAGTSVVIPTGYEAEIFCDGTDIKSTPLFVNGAVYATAGSNDNNLTTLAQVSALIAAQLTSGDGSFFVSADDTTRKFLESALTAGTSNVSLATSNGGGNETRDISVADLALVDGGDKSTSFTAVAGYRYTVDCTGGDITITAPASPSARDVILFEKYGTAGQVIWGRNGSNVKGQAEDGTTPDSFEGQKLMTYTGATRGWV